MKTVLRLFAFGFILLGLSRCGTIVGGSAYYARVIVPNHPNAVIKYEGLAQGSGTAIVKVKRSKANSLSLSVKEEGYDEQVFPFKQRTFRGWAFIGTIVTWTGMVSGIPLPWGLVVDLSDGSLWKPNLLEKGVAKMDHKNYIYTLDYTPKPSTVVVSNNKP